MKTSRSPHRAALLLACILCCTLTLPAAAAYRQHGAHVHGIAHLDVVLDGKTLEIDLDTPAANLLGFEHIPANKSERDTLSRTTKILRDAQQIFSLPGAAQCHSEKVTLDSPLLHKNGNKRQEHTDMRASYNFVCSQPAKLDGFTVQLFKPFPATEKLEVQLITPKGQGAAELTADSPRLHFDDALHG